MEFLVTEQQLKLLLKESPKDKLSDALKVMYAFTNNMVGKVMKVYGVNLKMFLMWGTSVAGLAMPLDNYIRNKGFNLDDNQRMLVLAGVVFILFFEGRRGMAKILTKIDGEGLEEDFKTILKKGKELKESFAQFVYSMKSTSATFLEVVAYSFLIPIIPDLFEMLSDTEDTKKAALRIAERMFASGLVLISREALITVLRKIIRIIKR